MPLPPAEIERFSRSCHSVLRCRLTEWRTLLLEAMVFKLFDDNAENKEVANFDEIGFLQDEAPLRSSHSLPIW